MVSFASEAFARCGLPGAHWRFLRQRFTCSDNAAWLREFFAALPDVEVK